MDKSTVETLNRDLAKIGVQLTLLEVDPVPEPSKPKGKFSTEDVNIIDPSFLPMGVWLNPKVLEAAKEVILEEYLSSGLVISGAEIINEEEVKDGEAKEIHKKDSSGSNRRAARKTKTSGRKPKDNTSGSSKGRDRVPHGSDNDSKAARSRKGKTEKGDKS